MYIPQGFKPEKNLEKHVKTLLKSPKKKEKLFCPEELTDGLFCPENLVLKERFADYMEIGNDIRIDYPFLDPKLVNNGWFVLYEDFSHIHIIEFKNKKVLKDNFQKFRRELKKKDEGRFQNDALFKGRYAVIIYSLIKNLKRRKEFMDHYKKRFDFKKTKVD